MKHYKDPNTDELYAFESDGSQDDWIPEHLVPVEDADVEAARELSKQAALNRLSPQERLELKQSEALFYLNSTDWYFARKLEIGAEIPTEVLIKRQEARAIMNEVLE